MVIFENIKTAYSRFEPPQEVDVQSQKIVEVGTEDQASAQSTVKPIVQLPGQRLSWPRLSRNRHHRRRVLVRPLSRKRPDFLFSKALIVNLPEMDNFLVNSDGFLAL